MFDILSAFIFLPFKNWYLSTRGSESKRNPCVWYLKGMLANMWNALTSSSRDASRHHQRASLIKGLLSELNGCSARQMPWGAASKWKVTSCVLISRHPWPLEGSAAEWAHYCSLTGHPSLSATKSALEHKHETANEGYGGNIYHPSSRCWCSQCFLFNELTCSQTRWVIGSKALQRSILNVYNKHSLN